MADLTERERQALAILEGCPIGATHDAIAMHGVAGVMVKLVRDGLVRARVVTHSNPPGLKVTWYDITDAGREALKGTE